MFLNILCNRNSDVDLNDTQNPVERDVIHTDKSTNRAKHAEM